MRRKNRRRAKNQGKKEKINNQDKASRIILTNRHDFKTGRLEEDPKKMTTEQRFRKEFCIESKRNSLSFSKI